MFREIKTRIELASVLGFPLSKLTFYAYANKRDYYTEFMVKKRDGISNRIILAPENGLKDIQKVIAEHMDEIYKQYIPSSVQGFVKGRSIVTNAELHLHKKYIVKVDLKDFFPSITADRVNGLFRSKPFNFSREVADCITRLVTTRNSLPQGSPASPVISNMICWKMDKIFMNYCKNKKILYSRYADDLTFSMYNEKSIKYLIKTDKENYDKGLVVTDDVESIIQKNRFIINNMKTGVFSSYTRQTVTGIVVNKKMNYRRKEYEQLRNLFWYWKKVGSTKLAADRYSSYFFSNSLNKKFYKSDGSFSESYFINHIRGKLDFYSMICQKNKSEESSSLERLWTWFNECTREVVPKISIKKRIFYIDCWITIGKGKEKTDEGGSGTGCIVEGIGFVTSCHCILPIRSSKQISEISGYHLDIQYDNKIIFSINSKKDLDRYIRDEIIQYDQRLDWARIIIPKQCFPKEIPFNLPMMDKYQINSGQIVRACGFADGLKDQKVVKARVRNVEQNIATVDCAFVAGMSGGPVLNRSGQILGIVSKGSNDGNYWRDGELIQIECIRAAFKKSTTN